MNPGALHEGCPMDGFPGLVFVTDFNAPKRFPHVEVDETSHGDNFRLKSGVKEWGNIGADASHELQFGEEISSLSWIKEVIDVADDDEVGGFSVFEETVCMSCRLIPPVELEPGTRVPGQRPIVKVDESFAFVHLQDIVNAFDGAHNVIRLARNARQRVWFNWNCGELPSFIEKEGTETCDDRKSLLDR